MKTNTAASVRARLTNHAKSTSRPFQEVLQHYGLERFLYRLSQSPHAGRFVLKGALMLRVWDAPESRPTRDIDFLGYVDNDVGVVERMVRDVCVTPVADDGLVYDDGSVAGQRIKEEADYQGIRITFTGLLERARVPMQLDIGFGDVVHPAPEERLFPTLLDLPAPRLRTYSRETVVAEKFEAMVQLGTLNSRMKDFFDIWLLARQFDFAGPDLASAIEKTFAHRGTRLEREPIALTTAFTADDTKQKQWAAFVRRSQLAGAPKTLDELRPVLRQFLLPIVDELLNGREFSQVWVASGTWRDTPGPKAGQ